MPTPRVHRQIQRQVPRVVVPQTPRQIQRSAPPVLPPAVKRDNRQSPRRIVVPKTTPAAKPPLGLVPPRVAVRGLRALPSTPAALNPGLRVNPGFAKPSGIAHNVKHRAGKAGWQHQHRPLFFKRDGHRWKRIYYTYPVAGLWYWYWYDVIADTDPAVLVYSEAVLPECYEDEDDCSGLETAAEVELIAPAILEGRATEEMMERCEDRYRTFERGTGTFTATTGEKRVCPYLL